MTNSVKTSQENFYRYGVAASPGISIGEVFLLDRQRVSVVEYIIAENEVEQQIEKFEAAVEQAKQQLHDVQKTLSLTSRSEHFYIIDTQLLILGDQMLLDSTKSFIRDNHLNAQGALKRVLEKFRQTFDSIEDEYLRERGSDIELVGERILRNLRGKIQQSVHDLDRKSVIVAHDLSPADTLQLDKVIVDGCSGCVIFNPCHDTLTTYREKQQRYQQYQEQLHEYCELPAQTLDGKKVKLKANIEFPEEAELAIHNGATGIGLLRTEFMYMARQQPPSEDDQFNEYRRIIQQVDPHPVTIRTLDIGGDKFVANICLNDEANPAMGLRSIRLSLREQKLFRIQLRAILRASALGPVRLLLPMISGVAEVHSCKAILNEVMAELRSEGIAFDEKIAVGIMIETPSAVLLADLLAKEVDFFSVGSNDLIQYCLVVDRGNEHVAYLYEPLHPAILRALNCVARAAQDAGIPACICGEMASEPIFSALLLAMGYSELSMNSSGISQVKKLLQQWHSENGDQLLEQILQLATATEVSELVSAKVKYYFPHLQNEGSFGI
ncbi:MAG: phosphoenolpyruvate--protein phosphotransferase [Desulfobacteraceae bacterium 4572_35.2]|nr:MAG: phosphoenolpyruvate--protein phosphotransferase [Desulfobacteraceae bacterium 4572_35.2]